ncbi:MAG TPA: PfkB family carbohydrate kinase [Anaerolineae bacterium]|nr:PfkB family carbohydrate kinase [Anaerolineae bacterium]HOR00134.1 PfkB family carbohydrate kinase [Anaerolineae bacterium]HPL28840.1 PfkB family carbohydrate kinase [Anaerolineae bacterium]
MSILVVGSVALDSIQTPFGRVREALGGAATYFSTVASLYDTVSLVGVVGSDFPREHIDFLVGRGVDIRGLQVAAGKTFRWSGRYDYDMNHCETLATELNVFATFRPTLPEQYRDAEYVFLANIDPELQMSVLDQVRSPRLIALDTMNYWIDYKHDALTEALKRVDIVLMNEAEARQFAKTFSLIRAAHKILELGPKALVIKKGEYGAVLFANGGDPTRTYFFAPAYPLEKIADPTGAGDTFAGGFMGYLAHAHAGAAGGALDNMAIRQAIVHGTVVASFTVEGFSLDRLRTLSLDDIRRRYEAFKRFTSFEVPCPWLGTCERLKQAQPGRDA